MGITFYKTESNFLFFKKFFVENLVQFYLRTEIHFTCIPIKQKICLNQNSRIKIHCLICLVDSISISEKSKSILQKTPLWD